MEPLPPSPTFDPDLDPPRRVAGPDRSQPVPPEFQRLLANPFLALVWLIVLFGLLRFALKQRNLNLCGGVLLGLVLVGYLLQYHCLDCGATGRLFRWKWHACPSVRARQQIGRPRRFRGPNPVMQTVLWVYILMGLAILVSVVGLALPN